MHSSPTKRSENEYNDGHFARTQSYMNVESLGSKSRNENATRDNASFLSIYSRDSMSCNKIPNQESPGYLKMPFRVMPKSNSLERMSKIVCLYANDSGVIPVTDFDVED